MIKRGSRASWNNRAQSRFMQKVNQEVTLYLRPWNKATLSGYYSYNRYDHVVQLLITVWLQEPLFPPPPHPHQPDLADRLQRIQDFQFKNTYSPGNQGSVLIYNARPFWAKGFRRDGAHCIGYMNNGTPGFFLYIFSNFSTNSAELRMIKPLNRCA